MTKQPSWMTKTSVGQLGIALGTAIGAGTESLIIGVADVGHWADTAAILRDLDRHSDVILITKGKAGKGREETHEGKDRD